MKFIQIVTLLSCLPSFPIKSIFLHQANTEEHSFLSTIQNIEELKKKFPTTIDEVNLFAENAVKQLQKGIAKIIAISNEKRNHENTLLALDMILGNFKQALTILEFFTLVSPDLNFKQRVEYQFVALKQTWIELVQFNENLYTVLKYYAANIAPYEPLTKEEQFWLNKILKDYQRDGLDLALEEKQQLIALQKKATELCTIFEQNIANSTTTIQVTYDELAGLDENFINNLKKTDTGLYIVGTDYPTYSTVREKCHTLSTRKALHKAYINRGYPENKLVLEKLLETRQKIAEISGYDSFSHYSIEDEMAQSPENVTLFLNDLLQKITIKVNAELKLFRNNLPDKVTLAPNCAFYPWDIHYIIAQYKIKNFMIDENELAHYFPMDHIIEQLLTIYHQFLDIDFKEESVSGLWHDDVRLITVHQHQQLVGYFLLDLYPRPGKYNHVCHITIPAVKRKNSLMQPALSVIIANFPKATQDRPSLLKRADVTSFFHEFAHALHGVIGATQLESLAGTRVKLDFAEMPSQMFEEWLTDKNILKYISSHYITGEPLPDHTIDTILQLKNLSSGLLLLQQIYLAFLSLETHKNNDLKDLDELNKKLAISLKPHEFYDEEVHFYARFGHLTGYNARYYSYLWSKVFALDLFDTIKKVGLLNPEIGVRYRDTILAAGGSKDPNELLEEFLGRKPNADAFIRDLGL